MYKLTNTSSIMRADGAYIPANPENSDYADYLLWLEQGNVPQPYAAPVTPIPPVSPRQIRQALTRAGIRTAVESAIAAGDQDAKDWYEFATQFERQHPIVVQMGHALGQSDAQLDALWELAATL